MSCFAGVRAVFVVAAVFGSVVGGCDCGDELELVRPALIVDPEEAILTGVPVAQDTPIVFQVPNRRTVALNSVRAVLSDDSDPNFTMVDASVERVEPGEIGTLSINVRPLVEGTIKARLIVDSDDPTAIPNHVEVPITVTAVDVGLPDIEVDPVEVDFETIGRGDIGRANVEVKNVGVRDLILDAAYIEDDADGVFSISSGGIPLATPPSSQNVGPRNATWSVGLIYRPIDTDLKTATLVLLSNDPDETEVRVPIRAQAVECPVAVATLVDEGLQIEPFDTVRLDGRDSFTTAAGTRIATPDEGGFQWTLLVRPVGSTAILASETNNRTEMLADLAGLYQVQLDVFAIDSSRPGNPSIKSCLPAIVDVDVKPSDDLLIQLVWDHPTADLDLHMLNEDGTVFTHEGDCYFSNRQPLAPDQPGWSTNPDENPRLDVDDASGYGPENMNLKHPAPGSRWKVLVHYWNRQTADVPNTTAIVRVFAYGAQAIELQYNFESDEQMWEALEIVWGEGELAPPTLTQLNVLSDFPRPF